MIDDVQSSLKCSEKMPDFDSDIDDIGSRCATPVVSKDTETHAPTALLPVHSIPDCHRASTSSALTMAHNILPKPSPTTAASSSTSFDTVANNANQQVGGFVTIQPVLTPSPSVVLQPSPSPQAQQQTSFLVPVQHSTSGQQQYVFTPSSASFGSKLANSLSLPISSLAHFQVSQEKSRFYIFYVNFLRVVLPLGSKPSFRFASFGTI